VGKGRLTGMTLCRIEASKIGRRARPIHLQSSELNASANAALVSRRFRPAANVPVMPAFDHLPAPTGQANDADSRGDDVTISSQTSE
jgi:hypothetical protein